MDSHVLAAEAEARAKVDAALAKYGVSPESIRRSLASCVVLARRGGKTVLAAQIMREWARQSMRRKSKGLRKHLRRTKAARKAEQ